MRVARVWLALALLAVVAGCAQPVRKQAFDRDAASGIRSVVITQAPNQLSYEAVVQSRAGLGFGLIGGLVAAAHTQYTSARLTAAVNAAETRLQDRFSAKLAELLTEAGYEPRVFVAPSDATDEQLVPLASQQGSFDAVLTVFMVGGYWAAGPSTDYLPRLFARVRAVDAGSGAVLYEDSFSYGYATPRAQTVHMASDARYRFATIDDLVADPEKARRGWYEGVDAIVAQLAAHLKRK